MPAHVQLSLAFACLDFPGRDTVGIWEIAGKTGYTVRHVLDHIDAGKLVALDSALAKTRRSLRVPVDEYRRWVLTLLTGEARQIFVRELPDATLREIVREGAREMAVRGLETFFPGATATQRGHSAGDRQTPAFSTTRG